MTAPLRVVELTRNIAGAACGRLFAGLGHDVIKLEHPVLENLRTLPPLSPEGLGLTYIALNADKTVVDLPEGELSANDLLPLLVGADVLMLDLLPSEAAAIGLTPDSMREAAPELVIVWITAFARDSEFAEIAGDSMLAEAYGGLATMIGDPRRRPLSLGGEQLAHASAITAFFGAMIALIRRQQGYGGDVVEVVMSDVAAYADWKSDVVHSMTGDAPRRAGTTAGEWKMLRARDGWVGAIFQQQHWGAMVALIDDPVLRDPALADEATRLQRGPEWWPVVDRWASDQTAEGIYESAQELGLPFGWAVRASDLVDSVQLRQRGFLAPTTREELSSRPAVGALAYCDDIEWRSGPARRESWTDVLRSRDGERSKNKKDDWHGATPGSPLEGMVVLDFGAITAGAAVTRLLADFGATVIKVESADRPDTFRMWKVPARPDDVPHQVPDSPYFASNNVGKHAIAVDLKTDEGRRIIHELAARSHVFVENFRVGVTERLGIDERTLHAINPALNYVSLSSQGYSGPESRGRSFGSTLDLLSGLASATGYDRDRPLWSSSDVNYPDQLVSLVGAAFVAYCQARDLTGVTLDISQREAVSWTLATQIADFLVNGVDSMIDGNRRPGRWPHDIYATRSPESWIAISCATHRQRVALAACIGSEELGARDSRWWEQRQDEVDRILSAWTERQDRDDAVAALVAVGIDAVPVLDAADRMADPGFAERLVRLPGEKMPVKGFPLRLAGYRPPPETHAPRLGEDTTAVLTEVLGMPWDEVERLIGERVVFAAETVGSPRRQSDSEIRSGS